MGNGNWSNQLIISLDQMWDMWGLETCLYEWNKHLQAMLAQVANGLGMTVENMRAYELSLLRNDGPVDNQSLHHGCTTPEGLQEAEDSSVQDMQEDNDDDGDEDWRNAQLCDVGLLHGRG